MRPSRNASAAALIVVLGVAGAEAARRTLRDLGAGPSLRGVRLGMTAPEVREQFVPPESGSWRALPARELVIEWQALAGSAAAVSAARFEFHEGALVAARLRVAPRAPEARGHKVEAVAGALIARRRAEDGRVELRMLARDCPTHSDEVSRLLSSR